MNLQKTATISMLLAAVAVSAVAAPQRRVGSADQRLATVNGEPVTNRDLIAIFTDRHGGHAKFLGGEEEARSFLKIVIDDRLLVQEAYGLGLDEEPLVKELVAKRETDLISKLLIKRELDEKSVPSAEEIESARNGLTFFLHVRQIAVSSLVEAEEVRRALLSGADFETLARTCSLAPSRGNGGHVIVEWGEHAPAWEAAVFALEVGETSQPIETDDGWEIIVVDNRIETEAPPLQQVIAEVRNALAKRKLEERKRSFTDELWSRYDVELLNFDKSPSGFVQLLANSPDAVIATWDGGGKVVAKDIYGLEEARALAVVTPKRFEGELAKRIRATVNGSLVVREAKRRNLDKEPTVAAEVDQYRDYVVESLLFRDHIFRGLIVTDEELRTFYDENKEQSELPEERRVAQIMVPDEATAQDIYKRLTAGADFGELAKTSSRDFSTAMTGGDLGWITADKVPAAFSDVLTLPAGGLLPPTKIGTNRWHIIKVLEIKPKRQQEFEAAKQKLHDVVLDSKRRKAREFWIERLRAVAKVEIDDSAIKKFVEENRQKDGEAPAALKHAIPAGAIKTGDTNNQH